jgi:hypothetical protein
MVTLSPQGLSYHRTMPRSRSSPPHSAAPSSARAAPTLQEQLPELRPGQSVELLKALHILTRDGKLNQDTRRKLKQVNHLLQFIEPLLQDCLKHHDDITLVDHGAGKSYLGFMLYDLFFSSRSSGWVVGVETRAELVQRSQALAQQKCLFDGTAY